MAEEQGCPWAGGCLVWAAEQTLEPAEQGKRKGCAFQNELLLSSCLLWKTQCSLQPYFTFQKREERPPRAFKCEICCSCRKVPVNSFCLLFLCEEKHHLYSYPSTELHSPQDTLLTFTPEGPSYYVQMHLWWIMLSQKCQSKYKSQTLSRFSFSGVNVTFGRGGGRSGSAESAVWVVKDGFFCFRGLWCFTILFVSGLGWKAKGQWQQPGCMSWCLPSETSHRVPPFQQFCSVKLSFPGRYRKQACLKQERMSTKTLQWMPRRLFLSRGW